MNKRFPKEVVDAGIEAMRLRHELRRAGLEEKLAEIYPIGGAVAAEVVLELLKEMERRFRAEFEA